MKKGEHIPVEVREFVRTLKQDQSELSYRQIKERAEARFPVVQIDKSSVANILKGWQKEVGPGEKSDLGQQPDWGEHRRMLIAALEGLRGIEPLGLHDRDIVTWWSRPEVPDWAVPKGRAWCQQGRGLRVKLDAESRREWQYLRQHLAESLVWNAIENCKAGFAHDLAARLQLMDRIAALDKQPQEGRGLGVPIQADLGFSAVTRSEVTIY